ncbi:uncharacterized protein LOC111050680 isoform X1 [Nilaparvata lugens]|uniref:uncharacterized protein LOC111050680 isoform X1 n=1 Tax=Nilaparvata lugens TaxID=108931 RepID=UPI00193E6168|nr:uncharacterized protein LOC111050680 isoform X1 [Nilaparvata lugens]
MDHLNSDLSAEFSSLSFDEEEQEVSHGIDILDRFDSDDLMELRKVFFDEKLMSKVEGRQVYSGLPLNKMEFVKAVDRIIGSSTYSVAASNLFDQISRKNKSSEKDVIWWEQILDAVIDKIQAQDSDNQCLRVVDETALKVHAITHCKRENIVKLVPLDTDTSFCYVAVSKYGQVGVYDGEINLLESYRVFLGSQTEETSRSTCTWVNDAIALPDATAILLAVSDRSLHFLTAAGLAHTPMFLISGIPNSPQCLSYHAGEPSLLFFGDDRGDITLMRFHQPAISLFRRTSTDRSNSYFWRELEGQDPWVTVSVDHNVHGDAVREIKYIPDNGTIVSCSSDPNASVVIRYLSGKRVPYIFKMTRGVRCFHLDRGLKLLVTGSTDNVVRIWNPVVNRMPIAVLYGHKTSIVDVRILRQYNAALSISVDGVLKVWDIEDNCCLQTIGLDIPVFSIVGKMIEFGLKTIYPGPSSAKPPLARQPKSSKKSSLKQSHPASLLSTASVTTKPSYTTTVGSEWLRPQIVVVCCNYAVTLPLTRHAIAECLPPPLREKEPLVPSPWLRADARTAQIVTPQEPPDTSKLSSLSEDRDLSEVISPRALKFIRHGPSDYKPKFRSLLSPAYGLYQSRTQQQVQDDDKHMASMVEQCAPHLALKLYHPEEIKFSQPLPVTRRMKSFDLSSPQKLMRVKLKSDTSSSIQGSCNGSTLHSINSRTDTNTNTNCK